MNLVTTFQKICRKSVSFALAGSLVVSASVLTKSADENFVKAAENSGVSSPDVTFNTKKCIYFGNYYQQYKNGDEEFNASVQKEPIKWQILSQTEDDVFIMADKILTSQPYHSEGGDITWENSSLRKWLNEEFFYDIFSEKEQQVVKTTHVVNEDSAPYYRTELEDSVPTEGGNDTEDKMYLLSVSEVCDRQYDIRRVAGEGAERTDYDTYHSGNPSWWLRTPGNFENVAAYIMVDGTLEARGTYVNEVKGIRPVLHLDPKSSVWNEVVKETEDVKLWIEKATWDTVTFGNYYAQDTNGDGTINAEDTKQPIVWRVLEVDGDTGYLMANQTIDYQKYHNYSQNTTWEKSTIRKWLNEDFYESAFSETEKNALQKISTSETEDFVALPSFEDMTCESYGFPKNISEFFATDTRKALPTAYARQQGNLSSEDDSVYWLRDMVNNGANALVVLGDGAAEPSKGRKADTPYTAVRPVIRIDLSKTGWEKGEPVTADDAAKYYASLDASEGYDEGGDASESGDDKGGTGTESGTGDDKGGTGTESKTGDGKGDAGTSSGAATNTTTGTGTGATVSATPEPSAPAGTKTSLETTAPAKVKLKSVTGKKGKKVSLSWKKVKGVDGYQIGYAQNKKFTKAKKTKQTSASSYVTGKLKRGKTYYFRVRAYRKSGAKKVYGEWSQIKKIKIKK